MRRTILSTLRAWLSPGHQTVMPEPGGRVRLSGKAIRIPLQGCPEFGIHMGKQVLHLCPDTGIPGHAADEACTYYLFDPQRRASGIMHFLGISPGNTLTIDSKLQFQEQVFSHPREAFRRHLSITHAGDALVLRDPISELGTYVSLIGDNPDGSSITRQRKHALLRVLKLFGGPLAPLPRDQATDLLIEVNRLLQEESIQHRDSMGNPGGLVQLPGDITPVIIGDLHANLDNLLQVLCNNAVLDMLENGTAALVFLGDAVHQDPPGQLDEMDSSLLMMDLIHKLMTTFPGQIVYIAGNHDSFQHELMKQGVPQGLLWDKHVVASRGDRYREQLELFYRQLPLLVISPDFIACHAGPACRSVSRQVITDIRQFPDLLHDLTWNRIKTAAYPGGYTRGNVRQFRKSLLVDPETSFIVGHYPFTTDETVWLNVGEISQHHILISSRKNQVGLFTRIDGVMVPQIYPAEPLLEWLNRQASATFRPAQPVPDPATGSEHLRRR